MAASCAASMTCRHAKLAVKPYGSPSLHPDGTIYPSNSNISMAAMTDGTSHTILVMETNDDSQPKPHYWYKPLDRRQSNACWSACRKSSMTVANRRYLSVLSPNSVRQYVRRRFGRGPCQLADVPADGFQSSGRRPLGAYIRSHDPIIGHAEAGIRSFLGPPGRGDRGHGRRLRNGDEQALRRGQLALPDHKERKRSVQHSVTWPFGLAVDRVTANFQNWMIGMGCRLLLSRAGSLFFVVGPLFFGRDSSTNRRWPLPTRRAHFDCGERLNSLRPGKRAGQLSDKASLYFTYSPRIPPCGDGRCMFSSSLYYS